MSQSKTCDQGRLVIAGTHSGTGKTTVTMGLLRLLSKTYKVQPFKVGPDYIDPTFHSHITGHKCRNLDSYLLSENTIKYLFDKNSKGKDFAVVEGVMGLFDGAKPDADIGSTAHIAKILKAPVVLVVDARAMSRSCGALIKGYEVFDEDVNLAGVIFNNVGSEHHFTLLKKAAETYTNVRVLGYLKKDENISLPSRHLGLVPQSELGGLEDIVDRLADNMAETVNMDTLLALVEESRSQQMNYEPLTIKKIKNFKVAIAYDEAFHFYYWDNIELLQELGGEIHFFSPLKDKHLPEADFIYLGGGFPEVFAEALSANDTMRQEMKAALENGLPCIAECGGYMYLCEDMMDLEGEIHHMLGVIEGHATMTKRLQRFGYATLTLNKECGYGKAGESIGVHEFHRSKIESTQPQTLYQLHKKRAEKHVTWQCGYDKGTLLAGYPHMHWYGNLSFIEHFISRL